MKFGIYSSIADPPAGENLSRCVDEVIEEAKLAEQAGFDSCFFGEHHQDKDGFLPSPLFSNIWNFCKQQLMFPAGATREIRCNDVRI